ncbi:ribonuclease H-like domain-containing protein [Rhizophagus clarus]|uniref:Ribonuclease H-like domain-containing protein n=1 Tax=Rhizophagus clarus TaxID=94130 RepID=A0A8H3KXN0_9GLOM|nr:ribonuclease H-like domain-containing protein [Rhizophagus clarus]
MNESKNPISFLPKKPISKPDQKSKEIQIHDKLNNMETHLVLSYHKVPYDVKKKFLFIIKTCGKNQLEVLTKKRKVEYQQSIIKYIKSNTIELFKKQICNHIVAKFFIYYGVAFYFVKHPFFIDMVKSLCLGYDTPCTITLSKNFLYEELANIIIDQCIELKRTKNLILDNKNKKIIF